MAHPIEIEVVGGTCGGDAHHVGDRWTFDGLTPGGVCLGAFYATIPFLYVLRTGGAFSWQEDRDVIEVCCPHGGITLRLTRKPAG